MAENETIIGAGTQISGEIRGDSGLTVRGRVEGKIAVAETLTVESDGIVQADVEAKSLVVSGVLVGEVVAIESVRLLKEARVVGNIQAPRVAMESGAAYRGRLDMGAVDLSEAGQASVVAKKVETRASVKAAAPVKAKAATKAAPKTARAQPRVVTVPKKAAAKAGPAWARKRAKKSKK